MPDDTNGKNKQKQFITAMSKEKAEYLKYKPNKRIKQKIFLEYIFYNIIYNKQKRFPE